MREDPHSARSRPAGVLVITAGNLLGWLATLGFWLVLFGQRRVPPLLDAHSPWERFYFAFVRGLAVADLTVSNVVLLAAIIGVSRPSAWGWTACYAANPICVYSMTATFARDPQDPVGSRSFREGVHGLMQVDHSATGAMVKVLCLCLKS